MKILHTSDWHLGISEEQTSLMEDQYYFIDRICEIIQRESIDVVIIAGDVYDRSNAGGNIDVLYGNAMSKLCQEAKVEVVEIAGNHDNSLRLSSCRELLRTAGLHVAGSLERDPQYVVVEDAQIFMLPWITEDKVKSIYPEERESITDLTEAYRVVTKHMEAAFLPEKRHILTAHAYVSGAETSTSDRAAVIGFATQISANVFDAFDYVALGHIHGQYAVNDRIRYCGTPMPYSFGKEEEQRKGVVIIDTEDMSQKFEDLPLLHKRKSLKGTLEEMLKADFPKEILNGYVRIEITDSYAGLEVLSGLRGIFSNLIYVSGKSFENETTSIKLTMEEFQKLESDPQEIFKHFCREIIGEEADEHKVSLFLNALKDVQEEKA